MKVINEYNIPSGIAPYHFTLNHPGLALTAGVGLAGLQPKLWVVGDNDLTANVTYHVVASNNPVPAPVNGGAGLFYVGTWVNVLGVVRHLFQELGV